MRNLVPHLVSPVMRPHGMLPLPRLGICLNPACVSSFFNSLIFLGIYHSSPNSNQISSARLISSGIPDSQKSLALD